MTIKWVFDPAPPSGQRTGGSAAEYSFQGSVDVLVREVIQNSLDAGKPGGEVGMVFRFAQISGKTLKDFLTSMAWPGIRDNLLAVPEDRGGKAIHAAVQRIEGQHDLRLLIIEDYGTKGLEGGESRSSSEETNPYCALVKDELYSDKTDETSGGSFGLGKSVLWAFSELKTVLFASVPERPPSGKSGLRFTGRAVLPWHSTEEDGECSGSGWLGKAVGTDHLRRAESVWSGDAVALAEPCLCSRADAQAGLSAVILGYGEPGETDRPLEEEAAVVVEAALESFWPALADGRLRVTVRVEQNESCSWEREVRPENHPGYRQLAAMLRLYREGHLQPVEALGAGQEGLSKVELKVPRRVADPSHGELTAHPVVLVRVLDESEEAGSAQDRIFRFRGPGMVVRAESHGNLSLGAQPYVAAVLAGEAASSAINDQRADAFLRAAEPPAHDSWTHKTRRIKQDYQAHGAGKKLEDFEKAIREAVRRLVSRPEEKGGSLPRDLLKHLRFSNTGGGKNNQFVSVTHQSAVASGGVWQFGARCKRLRQLDTPWHLRIRLKYGRDGGGEDLLRAIGHIEAPGSSRTEIRDGIALLEFPPYEEAVRFTGSTIKELMPAIGTRAVLALHVDAAAGGIPDA